MDVTNRYVLEFRAADCGADARRGNPGFRMRRG